MTTLVPARVRVRMYQVGFGDSVLVTVEYAEPGRDGRAERHILFDLGSTRSPEHGGASMESVAKLIAEHTRGRLDVLVVTHRHKDHLFGFGVRSSSKIIADLKPRLVLRPWTENPRLGPDATSPGVAPRTRSGRFAAALAAAQQDAERVATMPVGGRGALHDLAAAAEDQLPNADAVANLDLLSASRRGRYLHAGSSIALESVVPGLKVTVLGPPTVEQHPKVAGQVSSDPEYWMLRLQRALHAAAPDAGSTLSPGPEASEAPTAQVPPGPVRWLVEHLQEHRTHSVARLVRALDDALNNTSLILLLEVGGLSMLFPGDAQIENWSYTLDRLGQDAELAVKLAGIDLYKVGHHGSRNATPRSLHKLWTQRPAGAPRMTALMSTRLDVHGETEATAVPRATLVDALREVAELHSTHELGEGQPFVEVVAEASGGPFRRVTPAP